MTLPGTPSWLGVTNAQKALELILDHGDLTRNEIGELTGLSRPTAAQIIARLEASGLVAAVGGRSGNRGPTATSYGLRPGRSVGIAVDWQTELTRAVVVDLAGARNPVVQCPHPPAGSPADVNAQLRVAVNEALAGANTSLDAVSAIVIGVPAEVSPVTGGLSFTDKTKHWPAGNVQEILSAEFGRPVTLWNDVKVAAVAERQLGAGRDCRSFALFWAGEGVGVAVDVQGSVIVGISGGAGEIGYLGVPSQFSDQDPGARDLQALIGRRAITAIAGRYGVASDSFTELLAAIDAHHQRNEILTHIARRIAIGIEPVVAVLDPEAVILGGPVGALGGSFLANAVRDALAPAPHWHTRIESTQIGPLPVLSGTERVLHDRLRELLLAAVD